MNKEFDEYLRKKIEKMYTDCHGEQGVSKNEIHVFHFKS